MDWTRTFYKNRISSPLVRVLKTLKVTPNQVTIVNHIITMTLGVYFFSRGHWIGYMSGLFIMGINVILDHADGDLAKQTGRVGALGVWLDSVFDVIIQNVIIGAIAIGCFKQGLPLYIIVVMFISNSATNLVSFYYNNTFGFDSYTGSDLFRRYMDKKPHMLNRLFKNIIDPTSSQVGLVTFTIRYWLVVGILFNIMPLMFICITIINTFRWIVMWTLFTFHVAEYNKLWVSQALAILDDEREEYHELRNS